MSNVINITLQLKDKNIVFNNDKVDEVETKGTKSLQYYAKLETESNYCPSCGCVKEGHNIVKNGSKSSRITLPRISGLPAYLLLKKQRYYCRECMTYFTAKSDVVDDYCFISNRVKHLVMDMATETLTLKHIAERCQVSDHTVQRVINKAAEDLKHRPLDALPEHLSFDEFKSVKSADGHLSFIFIDGTNSRVVDIIEDRRKASLKNYFSAYALKERSKVKTITMDMYTPYMDLVKSLFPNAKIIIDRFHLIQALNRELNKYRVSAMNTHRVHNKRLYNNYKRYWRLILSPRERLDTWEYHKFRLFDWMTNTGGIVEYLLERNEILKNTYRIVHGLREALKDNNIEVFQTSVIQSKLLKLPLGLKHVLRTFHKLDQFIAHTFQYDSLSNGRIDGLNNKIKVLKRISYGYRNFNNFRTRILLTTKLYFKEEKTHFAA